MNLKTAVGGSEVFGSAIFRVWVASCGREARRRAQEASAEEGLEGARQDRPPCLRSGQVGPTAPHFWPGPGGSRRRRRAPGGGLSPGVRTRHANRRLPCVPRAGGDRRQEQRPACDRLAVKVGIGEMDEDVPPVVKQTEQSGRGPAMREIVRGEAAPAPLVLHFIQEIFDIPFTMPLIN